MHDGCVRGLACKAHVGKPVEGWDLSPVESGFGAESEEGALPWSHLETRVLQPGVPVDHIPDLAQPKLFSLLRQVPVAVEVHVYRVTIHDQPCPHPGFPTKHYQAVLLRLLVNRLLEDLTFNLPQQSWLIVHRR